MTAGEPLVRPLWADLKDRKTEAVQEHRIVYLVSENRIDFLQARYHY